jgi:hypothetical protein
MTDYLKYFFPLFILFLLLVCGTLVVNSSFSLGMNVTPVVILVSSFALSTLISLLIFKRGLSLEPEAHTMSTFVAVGIKFLLELFIALLWFVAAKKTSAEYILLFFVLYLAFSLFSIIVLLKTLKKKTL